MIILHHASHRPRSRLVLEHQVIWPRFREIHHPASRAKVTRHDVIFGGIPVLALLVGIKDDLALGGLTRVEFEGANFGVQGVVVFGIDAGAEAVFGEGKEGEEEDGGEEGELHFCGGGGWIYCSLVLCQGCLNHRANQCKRSGMSGITSEPSDED